MKGEQRKMKKFFKKLMVVVLAVAVSSMGARTEKAEAGTGTCPHEEIYRQEMSGSDIIYTHSVEVDVPVEDKYGVVHSLSELVGHKCYAQCTVSFKEISVAVKCKKCNRIISTYKYLTPEMHSYCGVG